MATKRSVVGMSQAMLLLVLAGWACPGSASAKPPEAVTVQNAATILQENVEIAMQGIPLTLLGNAQAIALIPDVFKAGFVLGGLRGHGVMVVRNQDGSWSNPIFITITGGSIGYQIGLQMTDLILVFQSRRSVDQVLRGQFTLGANAAVAAGPVGRQAAAGTDIQLKAEIYSYSRSKGLFAGVSLDGSLIQIDGLSNAAYYATPSVTPQGILGGQTAQVPAQLAFLKDILGKLAAPAPGTTSWMGESTMPTVAVGPVNLELTRQQLVASAAQLHARLDENWKKYLALPSELASPSTPANAEAIAAAVKRYDAVSSGAPYAPLQQLPEFQTTHRLLRNYLGGISATASRTPQAGTLPAPVDVAR